MAKTPGKTFYDRQVAYLEARDLDRLMTQYHEDAEIIGFDFAVKGHEAIHKHFGNYLKRIGFLTHKSTDKFTETEDAIFFEATVLTALGEARVLNNFVLKDGKASHHFTAVISVKPLEAQAQKEASSEYGSFR
jgi:hypothetical protein